MLTFCSYLHLSTIFVVNSGYMAPEYAMNDLFSVKSDVFSFGVLLLEIISGKRNNRPYSHEIEHNLLSYVCISQLKCSHHISLFIWAIGNEAFLPNLTFQAWVLWCERKVMELMDPILIEPRSRSDTVRLIHIGLLCVQVKAADRPTMSSVVVMLGSESLNLPQPIAALVYVEKRKDALNQSLNNPKTCSPNNVTITDIEPR